jgi:hypothetical protein
MSNSRTHGGGTPATATTPFVPSPDFQYWSLSLGLNWSHRFSKTTSGALYGGGYGYSTTPQNATTRYTLTVSGGGSFDAQVLQEGRLVVSAGVGVGVGPGVNTITADFQERVQGTGHLNASYEKFHFGVNADATQTIPIVGPHAARLFGAGASVGYSPAKFLDLSAEYRSTWQSIGTGSLGRLWFAFLNVSVVGPPVRF